MKILRTKKIRLCSQSGEIDIDSSGIFLWNKEWKGSIQILNGTSSATITLRIDNGYISMSDIMLALDKNNKGLMLGFVNEQFHNEIIGEVKK